MIKTDFQGNNPLYFTHSCEGIEAGYSIVQTTTDGGYLIAGLLEPSLSTPVNALLIKLDSQRRLVWLRGYGEYYFDAFYSVQQTQPSGNFISVGTTCSYGSGGDDIWLLAIDKNGNQLWERFYGGSGDDVGYCVQQTTDTGFIITGYTNSNLDYSDIWLIKTSGNGELSWQKRYGGAYDDVGYSVRQTSDSGFILTGYTRSYGAGNADVWLIKTTGSPMDSMSDAYQEQKRDILGGRTIASQEFKR